MNGYFEYNRQEQARHWFFETLEAKLKEAFYNNDAVKAQLKQLEQAVVDGKMSSSKGASELLNAFLSKKSGDAS